MQDVEVDLAKPYSPTALYYEDADSVEYVRTDDPFFCERVDERLTLVRAMEGQEIIGFRLKGFKNFYLRDRRSVSFSGDFYSLVGVLERVVSDIGQTLFEPARRDAYQKAWRIALQDRVELSDLPKVA